MLMFRALQAGRSAVVVGATSRGLSTSAASIPTAASTAAVSSFLSRVPTGVKYAVATLTVAETGAAGYLYTHPDQAERLKHAMFS